MSGATGHLSRRLAPRLLQARHAVRCLVREAQRLPGRPWASEVEIGQGDALESAL
ncbi:MAG: NAD(P)H-binding protein [Anaerolineales bacterium]